MTQGESKSYTEIMMGLFSLNTLRNMSYWRRKQELTGDTGIIQQRLLSIRLPQENNNGTNDPDHVKEHREVN